MKKLNLYYQNATYIFRKKMPHTFFKKNATYIFRKKCCMIIENNCTNPIPYDIFRNG